MIILLLIIILIGDTSVRRLFKSGTKSHFIILYYISVGSEGRRDPAPAGRTQEPAQRVPDPYGQQGGSGHGDCRVQATARVRGRQAGHRRWG